MEPIDGFWLPSSVRQQVLTPGTGYANLSFARGRPCEPGDAGAITVRWPLLQMDQWERLLAALEANRRKAPRGQEFWKRFQAALEAVSRRLADPAGSLHALAMATLLKTLSAL